MRVLVVTRDFPSPGRGEGGIAVVRQIAALREQGHDIAVAHVVPHAPPLTARWRAYHDVPDRYEVEGVPVRTIRAVFPPRLIGMEYVAFQTAAALRSTIAQFAPDLVHAHYVIPSGHVALRQPLPVVVTAHGSDAYDWPWRRRGLHRAAAQTVRDATVVVAVSQFIADRARALGRDDVEVVYNGADERFFFPHDRHAARESLGIAPDRFTIAFAGRVQREKGVYDLLEAAARLGDVRPLLLFAGPAHSDAAFAERVSSLGVETRTLGMLDLPHLAKVLRAADVFCLPSYREGLPLALCEAMLAGLPCVASGVGGIPEILSDGDFGFIVPAGDVTLLAQRLGTLAADPQSASAMGERAHRFARSNLTWTANARRYGELYRRALDARTLRYSKTKAACTA